MLICVSYLYILNVNSSSGIPFTNIFSHSVGLFILLIVSIIVQNSLILYIAFHDRTDIPHTYCGKYHCISIRVCIYVVKKKYLYKQYLLSLHNKAKKCEWVIVAQSCLTLCNPMNYSLTGSSVHGNLQARLLEWVTISTNSLSEKNIESKIRRVYWYSCVA